MEAQVVASAVNRSCSLRASQRKPVVAPPAECAANRAKSKHETKPVQCVGFSRLEFYRFAAGTNVPEPEYAWKPVRPDNARMIHRDLRSAERLHAPLRNFSLPNLDSGCPGRWIRGVNPTGFRRMIAKRLHALFIQLFASDSAQTDFPLDVCPLRRCSSGATIWNTHGEKE
jgi:hypothetical protein